MNKRRVLILFVAGILAAISLFVLVAPFSREISFRPPTFVLVGGTVQCESALALLFKGSAPTFKFPGDRECVAGAQKRAGMSAGLMILGLGLLAVSRHKSVPAHPEI